MNIAILGFGTVGKGAYEIIKNNGLDYITVSKILKRKGSALTKPEMVDDFDVILNDDSIDTVVECMGGSEPAFSYVSQAMRKKKNVVTSNKLLVATHYDELIKLSDENDVYFMFEASVGGGIPWIENLSRVGFVDDVLGFKAIFNGTTNYILDKMTNGYVDFDVALKETQDMGFAEKDPSSDIDGDDLLYKTIISANVATRKSFSMENVLKFGIRYLTKEDMAYFKKSHLVLKLITTFDRDKNLILVMPELFDENAYIANVGLNYNYVELYCKTEGRLIFIGPGAGSLPTGHSIVQDLVRISQNAVVPIYTTEKVIVNYQDFTEKFYIRYDDGKVEIVNGMTVSELKNSTIKFIARINSEHHQ
ncbi:MAG: homoserine dehydrogenase [Lachnospiraceae bacterium]|nr:homoserine dehydrogenase [Lachnospiraceae bacterium]